MLESQLDRRTFLAAAAAGGAALGAYCDPAMAARRHLRRVRRSQVPLARNGSFRQSVASGQPDTRGITLWTRVEELDRTSLLQVEISPDEDFRRILYRKNVTAEAERDFTVIHRAQHSVLRPGEQYFYRFYTCNQTSPVGRFRIARPADSREPVRIGFFSCQRWERGYFTAHAAMAKEPDLDLVVCLGDYYYEERTSNSVDGGRRRDTTGANGDAEVQTLPEYRDKYRLYHSDPDLMEVRRTIPMMAIWDDHEAENNYAGQSPSQNPAEENVTKPRRVPFLDRRANAYRAFFEHMPRIRNPVESDRIYGSVPLGANAEMFFLDSRQYRDAQPCGDRVASPCSEAERSDPRRTLLGRDQKEWLKGALAASRATWKLVANQVMIMALDIPARNPVNPDQWDGYAAERREILEFVQSRGIRDVSFLTGDIHTFFAGNVTPSGREGNPVTDGVPVATEFVGGSISSQGLGDGQGLNAFGAQGSAPLDATIRGDNPHIKYTNTTIKGYGVLEARSGELLVDFRGVETVARPQSRAFTLQRFRVARGSPQVETLGPVTPSRARRRRR